MGVASRDDDLLRFFDEGGLIGDGFVSSRSIDGAGNQEGPVSDAPNEGVSPRDDSDGTKGDAAALKAAEVGPSAYELFCRVMVLGDDSRAPRLAAALGLAADTPFSELLRAALLADGKAFNAFRRELQREDCTYVLVGVSDLERAYVDRLGILLGSPKGAGQGGEEPDDSRLSIDRLSLTTRARNVLDAAGVATIPALIEMGWDAISSMPSCGNSTLTNIRTELAALGLPVVDCFSKYVELEPGSVPPVELDRLQLSQPLVRALARRGFTTARSVAEHGFHELETELTKGKVETVYQAISGLPGVERRQFDLDKIEETLTEGTDLESEGGVPDGSSSRAPLPGVWHRADALDSSLYPDSLSELYALSLLSRKRLGLTTEELIETSLARRVGELAEDVRLTLGHLANEDKVTLDSESGLWLFALPAAVDVIAERWMDERAIRIARARLSGRTLQEVSDDSGLTRERVRQVCVRVLTPDVLRQSREGRLIAVAKKMGSNVDGGWEAALRVCFDASESEIQACRLCGAGRSKGANADNQTQGDGLEALVANPLIPQVYRERVERYRLRNYIHVEGAYIERTKKSVLSYLLRRHASKVAISEDEVAWRYGEFCAEHNLHDDEFELRPTYIRGTLHRIPNVLTVQGRRLRYWDFSGHDVSALVDSLDWEHFDDREFSAQAFFTLQPELMNEYDLHSGHELHNVLRHYLEEYSHGELPYRLARRSPILLVGAEPWGRERQVVEMAQRMAPVSVGELADAYCEEYGIEKPTFLSNYLVYIASHIVGDTIIFDRQDDVPKSVMQAFGSMLVDDWYSLEELFQLCQTNFPGHDLLDAAHLGEFGFVLMSDCAIRLRSNVHSRRGSLGEYYGAFFEAALVRRGSIPKKIRDSKSFNAYIWHESNRGNLIDYDAETWITWKGLDELGITRNNLRSFYDECAACLLESGLTYATVPFLRRNAPNLWLFDFEMDDVFYESVLQAMGPKGSFGNYRRRRIFSFGKEPYGLGAFISEIVKRRKSMDVYELIQALKDCYSIETDRSNLLDRIKSSELFYSPAADRVYETYDAFLDNVK